MERISEGIPSTLPFTKTGRTEEKQPERKEIPARREDFLYGDGNGWERKEDPPLGGGKTETIVSTPETSAHSLNGHNPLGAPLQPSIPSIESAIPSTN
jgi:hypothetical protein